MNMNSVQYIHTYILFTYCIPMNKIFITRLLVINHICFIIFFSSDKGAEKFNGENMSSYLDLEVGLNSQGPTLVPQTWQRGHSVRTSGFYTSIANQHSNTSQECKKITWSPPSSKPLSQMWTSPFLWIDKSDVQYDAPPCSNNDIQTRKSQNCKRELPGWVPMIRIDGKTSSSPNYWENLQMG
jgi:hypothetical protein